MTETTERLARIRELAEKGTQGEFKVATWRAKDSVSVAIIAGVADGDEYIVAEMVADDDQAEADAKCLVSARDAVPYLLSQLDTERQERDNLDSPQLCGHMHRVQYATLGAPGGIHCAMCDLKEAEARASRAEQALRQIAARPLGDHDFKKMAKDALEGK